MIGHRSFYHHLPPQIQLKFLRLKVKEMGMLPSPQSSRGDAFWGAQESRAV